MAIFLKKRQHPRSLLLNFRRYRPTIHVSSTSIFPLVPRLIIADHFIGCRIHFLFHFGILVLCFVQFGTDSFFFFLRSQEISPQFFQLFSCSLQFLCQPNLLSIWIFQRIWKNKRARFFIYILTSSLSSPLIKWCHINTFAVVIFLSQMALNVMIFKMLRHWNDILKLKYQAEDLGKVLIFQRNRTPRVSTNQDFLISNIRFISEYSTPNP